MIIDTKTKAAFLVELDQKTTDYLLSINTHNREKIQANIGRLKKEMLSGEWELISTGIGISSEGYITNGQNRLLAHKEAGYPAGIHVVIVTGLSPFAQQKEDTHAKRNMAAIIKLMMNKTYSNQVISAVRVCLKIRNGRDGFWLINDGGETAITENMIAEFIEEHGDIIDRLRAAVGKFGVATRSGIFAALIDFARRGFVKCAVDLADQIRTGANIDINDPAYKLRAWKCSGAIGGQQYQLKSYEAAVTACVAFAQGRELKQLKASQSWDQLPSITAWNKKNLEF